MGYIYKITNKVNNRLYIGQTKTSMKARWQRHLTRFHEGSKQGIYGAMHKYGIENFIMEKIIECPNEDLNEMECYYINKYDTYNNGYNLTLGGQGTKVLQFTEQQVIEKYYELGFITDVAEYFNCCVKQISDILHSNHIEISIKNKVNNKNNNKTSCRPVRIVELDKVFESLTECGLFLVKGKYCKTNDAYCAQRSINRVLSGGRKTYCKFHFEYV